MRDEVGKAIIMSKTRGQATLGKVVTKKVNFAMSEKEEEDWEKRMRDIVLEEVKKVKQERLKVEKIKVLIDERNAEVLERMEILEKKFEQFEEKMMAKMEALVLA